MERDAKVDEYLNRLSSQTCQIRAIDFHTEKLAETNIRLIFSLEIIQKDSK